MKNIKKLCSAFLSFSMIISSFEPAFAAQNNENKTGNTPAPTVISQNDETFQQKITMIDDIVNPTFVAGELTKKSDDAPDKIVENYYNKELSSDLNNNSIEASEKKNQFKKIKEEKTTTGKTIVKTIQTYEGTPIFGTEQNFNVNKEGVIDCIIGSNVDEIGKKITFQKNAIKASNQDVLEAVEKDLGFKPEYDTNPTFELTLYPVKDNYVYSYKVSIDYNKPKLGGYTYYVDAKDLSILTVFNHTTSAEQPTTGTGIGQVTSEVKNLNMVVDDTNKYYLQDTVRDFMTTNQYGIRYSEPDNSFNSGTSSNYQQDAVDGHYNIANVFDFYKEVLGRTGIYNGAFSSTYNVYIDEWSTGINAYGDPGYVRFLTGHGAKGRSLASCLDVAGHEVTHGIMTYEGLLYSPDSEYGSIHEGLADVFGTICEYFKPSEGTFDWFNAEDAGNPLRDCANPLIDDYDDYITEEPECHSGGGVITKAAYLIAEGGTLNGKTIAPIDADKDVAYTKLAKIFYDVIDNNLIPTMTFLQFASAAVCSADALYGMNAASTILDAFEAVDVLFMAAPTNFKEIGTRDGQNINFSWDGRSGDTYAIYRSNGDSLVKFDNTTNFTATASTEYGKCKFYVAQVDSSGNRVSAYSNAVTIEMYAPAPTLTMTSRDGFYITFNWNDTGWDGDYLIYGMVNGTIAYCDITTNTTSTLYVDSVAPCYFYVQEIYPGTRKHSEDSNVIIIENAAAPTNLTMSSRDGLDIQLSWTGIVGKNYGIFRKITGSSDVPTKLNPTTTTTTYSTTNLVGSYDYYVAQLDSNGYRMSNYSDAVTIDSPAAPSNFRLTQKSGLQCGFSWNSTIGSYYAIYRKVTGSTDTPTRVTEPSTNNVNVSAATLLGSYDFFVAQVDSNGTRLSDFSTMVTVNTN